MYIRLAQFSYPSSTKALSLNKLSKGSKFSEENFNKTSKEYSRLFCLKGAYSLRTLVFSLSLEKFKLKWLVYFI